LFGENHQQASYYLKTSYWQHWNEEKPCSMLNALVEATEHGNKTLIVVIDKL
jgi:hypothetical protein